MTKKLSPETLSVMRSVMQAHVVHIMLCELVKEANHTPNNILHDYRLAATALFRDEVIGIVAGIMLELLATDDKENEKLLRNLLIFAGTASKEMSKSHTRFKHLFDHLRQEHKTEIEAACAEAGFTGEGKD